MGKKSDEKKSFKLYNNYAKQFEKLDDASAGQLIKAIFAYVNNEPIPEFDNCGADMAFSFIAAQLDRDKDAYDQRCEVNRKNGNLGGRPAKRETQSVSEEPDAFEENRSVSSEPVEAEIIQTDKPKSLQEQRFDQFWDAYPKKVGKKAALTAWNKVKPDTELFGKILQAVDTAKASDQWRKENGQFIPYPATWLNQGRWDDEPTTQTAKAIVEVAYHDPLSNPWERRMQNGH